MLVGRSLDLLWFVCDLGFPNHHILIVNPHIPTAHPAILLIAAALLCSRGAHAGTGRSVLNDHPNSA